jgi:hypothetical protein
MARSHHRSGRPAPKNRRAVRAGGRASPARTLSAFPPRRRAPLRLAGSARGPARRAHRPAARGGAPARRHGGDLGKAAERSLMAKRRREPAREAMWSISVRPAMRAKGGKARRARLERQRRQARGAKRPRRSGASGVSCIGGGMKRESPHPAKPLRPHPRMRCRPGIRLMAHSWQIVSSRAEKTCACRRPSQGSAPAFRSLRRLARPLAGHAGRPLATEGIQGGRLNQAGESAAPLPMPPNRQLSLGRAYRP